MADHAIFNLLADPSWLGDHWGWLVAAAIVVLGLLGAGLRDLGRFSPKRIWALSGVCFDESIRKRVLWIAPLAMLGVIVVTELQKALDEQDALRQSLKFCLFATGTVAVMVSIILAATNLPRDIETRVIYTIVTKPTTRLELILGKIVGFARVSLALLLIMGLFTWGYLRVRERRERGQIAHRLRDGDVGETEQARLTHYLDTGLLTARTLRSPDQFQVYGRMPDLAGQKRVISDQGNQDVLAEFSGDRAALFGEAPPEAPADQWAHQGIGQFGLVIRVELNTRRTGPANDQPQEAPTFGPTPPKPKGPKPLLPPSLLIDVFGSTGYQLVGSQQMFGAADLPTLRQEIADFVKTSRMPSSTAMQVRLSRPQPLSDGGQGQVAYAWVPPSAATRLFNEPFFYVRFTGASDHVDYEVGPQPVRVFVPQIQQNRIEFESPGAREVPLAAGRDGQPLPLTFRGRMGLRGGQEIKGTDSGPSGIGVFSFRHSPTPAAVNGQIPMEVNVYVDRAGAEVLEGHEAATTLDVAVYDRQSGSVTTQSVQVESRQIAFFTVPAAAITGPDYDVAISCPTPGRDIGLFPADSLQVVLGRQSFEFNLLKSLCILWMMSILVVSLAVFCSTFLSWPIALVLTVVLLLGRWGVNQLADVTGPGLGRQIVNEFRFNDAPVAEVVSTSVDALSRSMNLFSRVLPDMSRFEAIGDIEQGVSIPGEKLAQSLGVLVGFGLPAAVAAYLVMKRKEVAP